MGVGSADEAFVTLNPALIDLGHSEKLTQFSIIEYELGYAMLPEKGLQPSMKLKRKITSEMMTTYFPSIFLLMITFSSPPVSPSGLGRFCLSVRN